jgi:hypothetical protein
MGEVKFANSILGFLLQLVVSYCALLFLKLVLFLGQVGVWSAYFKQCPNPTCPAGVTCDCKVLPDFLIVEAIERVFTGVVGLFFALIPLSIAIWICFRRGKFPWEYSERGLRWTILILLAISINGLVSYWLNSWVTHPIEG